MQLAKGLFAITICIYVQLNVLFSVSRSLSLSISLTRSYASLVGVSSSLPWPQTSFSRNFCLRLTLLGRSPCHLATLPLTCHAYKLLYLGRIKNVRVLILLSCCVSGLCRA